MSQTRHHRPDVTDPMSQTRRHRPPAPGHPQGVALLYTSHAGVLYIVGLPLAGGLGNGSYIVGPPLAGGLGNGSYIVGPPLAGGLGNGSYIVGPPLAGGLRGWRRGVGGLHPWRLAWAPCTFFAWSRQIHPDRGEALTHCLRGKLGDEGGTDDALAVNEVAGGDSSHAIGLVDRASRIEEQGIGQFICLAEAGDIRFRVGLVDAQQNEVALTVLRIN